MSIYIVIVEDRHTDAQVRPFSTAAKAIHEAIKIGKAGARSPEDYQQRPDLADDEWLFFAQYSGEGDCVRVVKAELDKCTTTQKGN